MNANQNDHHMPVCFCVHSNSIFHLISFKCHICITLINQFKYVFWFVHTKMTNKICSHVGQQYPNEKYSGMIRWNNL